MGRNVTLHTVFLTGPDSILVELKSLKAVNDIHRAQCINYLRATGLRLCLLLNFGNTRLEIKRLVL